MKRRNVVGVVLAIASVCSLLFIFRALLVRKSFLFAAKLFCVLDMAFSEGPGHPASRYWVPCIQLRVASFTETDELYAAMESVVLDSSENSLWRAQSLEFLRTWPGRGRLRRLSPQESQMLWEACYKALGDKSVRLEFRAPAIDFAGQRLVAKTEDALSKGGFVAEKGVSDRQRMQRAKKLGFVNPYQSDVDRTTEILGAILAAPREGDGARVAAASGLALCLLCVPSERLCLRVQEQMRSIIKDPNSPDRLLWGSICVLWYYYDLAHCDLTELREIRRKLASIRDKHLVGNVQNFLYHHVDPAIAEADKKEAAK